MQNEDKAEETPIGEVKTAADVEDNIKETSKEEEETPEKGDEV